MMLRRNVKICAYCGKTFIVPGTCGAYLYRKGKRYYCGYNHWREAEQDKPQA
jgi:hypothetical protein